LYNLTNKVALVTGAGGEHGMGRAIAVRLAKEGANLVVNDLKSNPKNSSSWSGLPDVVKEIETLGKKALSVEADVSVASQVNDMIQQTIQTFNKIDILVNNAASTPGLDRVPVIELKEDVWDYVLRINAKGTFLCCKAVSQILIKQGYGGKIINMSSVSGINGVANFGAYCASKFAVRGLTQVLAKELGPHDIQVNAICPGMIVTERTQEIAKALSKEGVSIEEFIQEDKKKLIARTPLGKIATPNDIAQIAAFLASSESNLITGKSFTVDGGATMN
jgi:NAD(P)-dependent dehydrogenase (short-subunit alcohol dehydrogenase family)